MVEYIQFLDVLQETIHMDSTSSKTVHDIQWETSFHLLEEFIAEFGRLPSRSEIYQGFKLGLWCNNLRARAIKPNYPKDRLERLKALGFFGTIPNIYEDTWKHNFDVLKSFIYEYHRFPQQQETYKDVNIGAWYASQKTYMQKDNYPIDRIAKLYALGIHAVNVKDKWQYHYELLKSFVAQYQRLPKQLEEYEGVKIGLWCARQKQQAKQSNYPEEYKEKLSAIGLLNSNKSETKKGNKYTEEKNKLWDEKYQLLIKFMEEYGRVPSGRETYQNVNIGDWYNHQKTLLKHSELPDERKEKLAAIGIVANNNNNS